EATPEIVVLACLAAEKRVEMMLAFALDLAALRYGQERGFVRADADDLDRIPFADLAELLYGVQQDVPHRKGDVASEQLAAPRGRPVGRDRRQLRKEGRPEVPDAFGVEGFGGREQVGELVGMGSGVSGAVDALFPEKGRERVDGKGCADELLQPLNGISLALPGTVGEVQVGEAVKGGDVLVENCLAVVELLPRREAVDADAPVPPVERRDD